MDKTKLWNVGEIILIKRESGIATSKFIGEVTQLTHDPHGNLEVIIDSHLCVCQECRRWDWKVINLSRLTQNLELLSAYLEKENRGE